MLYYFMNEGLQIEDNVTMSWGWEWREKELYLMPVGPERGHMAANAAEKLVWALHVALSARQVYVQVYVQAWCEAIYLW